MEYQETKLMYFIYKRQFTIYFGYGAPRKGNILFEKYSSQQDILAMEYQEKLWKMFLWEWYHMSLI